mmetsp:Transcript_14576/g.43815  ORF Transcript_14576/g.43815 Transcript_14576/m.43815 type:complete len:245 (-) Transcript_14576:633-1367(-)
MASMRACASALRPLRRPAASRVWLCFMAAWLRTISRFARRASAARAWARDSAISLFSRLRAASCSSESFASRSRCSTSRRRATSRCASRSILVCASWSFSMSWSFSVMPMYSSDVCLRRVYSSKGTICPCHFISCSCVCSSARRSSRTSRFEREPLRSFSLFSRLRLSCSIFARSSCSVELRSFACSSELSSSVPIFFRASSRESLVSLRLRCKFSILPSRFSTSWSRFATCASRSRRMASAAS